MKSSDRSRESYRRSTLVGLVAILSFASVTRVVYFLLYRGSDPRYSHLLHDAAGYHGWAGAFAVGESPPDGVFYQAPGYPYLLGWLYRLFGAEPAVGYLFQMAAGLFVIFLVFRIAQRAYGERAALAAAALAALYATYPFYETKLVSATIALALACLIVDRLQAARASNHPVGWILAGLATGAAVVVRPNLLLLVLFVVVWILLDLEAPVPRRALSAACFLAAVAVLIFPVTLRNYRVGGEPVMISANGGITFFHGNNPEAKGWFSAPGMSGSIARQQRESRRLAENAEGRTLTDGEVSRFWFRRGMAFIGDHPTRYGILTLRKFFLAFDDYEHGLNYNPQTDINPARFLFPLTFAGIFALAVARGLVGPRLAKAEIPILLLLAVQLATLIIFYCSSRYRLPATGALLAIAGAGAIGLWDRLRSSGRNAWVPVTVAVLAAVFSIVKLPPGGSETYRTRSANAVCDLALAYHKTGKLDEAVETYREAIDRSPDYAYAHLDMAKVLRDQSRDAEAESSINKAIELAPNLAEAHFDLGNVYLATERIAPAADAFAEAVRIDPSYVPAGNNLIGSYLTLGRTAEAVEQWRKMKARGFSIHPGLEDWMRQNTGGP